MSFNPSCYLPSAVNQYLHSSVACPPPPTYLSTAYDFLTSPISSIYTTVNTVMGAILSLGPMLSFLLIPTMTSYSTSLNLLFFYLTWSTLILSHKPLRVEIVSTLTIRFLFYILPSIFLLAFDVLLPSTAESFKSTGPTGLPFLNASCKRTLRLLRTLSWSIANTLLSVLAQAATELTLTNLLTYRPALRVTTSLPTPWQIVIHLFFGYATREILAYTIHRYILHESNSRLARYHQTWYHSIPAPFPLSATYDHPASYLLRSFLPQFLPALFFRFHLLTYLLYLTFISLEETWTYSGYSSMPTNFILGGVARRTDNHVLCGGEGNFAPFGIIDWVMGTSVGTDVADDFGEVERRDVRRRVQRKGKGFGDGAKDRLRRRTSGKSRSGGRERGDET